MFAPQTPIFDENATSTPSRSALHKRSMSTPGLTPAGKQGFATPKSKAKAFGTPSSRRFGNNLTNTGGKQSVNRQHSVQKKVRTCLTKAREREREREKESLPALPGEPKPYDCPEPHAHTRTYT